MRPAILTLLLTSSTAFACDAPQVISSSAPADGDTDVPLNARLFVFFEHGGDNWIDFNLRTGSTPVGASTAVRFGGRLTTGGPAVALVTPVDPLLPNTEYTLTGSSDDLQVDGSAADWTISFTTGTETDTTPPTYDGISSAGFSVVPGSTADDCAKAPKRWSFSATGSEPPVDNDIVAYAVYRSTFPVVTGLSPQLTYELLPETYGQQQCLTLQAIDQAGNVSTSTAQKCATPVTPEDDTDDPTDTDETIDTGEPWTEPTDSGTRDSWRWESETGDWGNNWGRNGLTVRVCGPAITGVPGALIPLTLLLFFSRRRRR